MLYYGQIVGNEEVGELQLLLKVLKHIHHLGLNRYVQGGYGLIADDELRLYCQGPGNAHSLALSAGKLVGITVCLLRVQAYGVQKLQDPLSALLGVLTELMDIDTLADDVSHRHTGIQGSIGILEYDLHLPAVGSHILFDVFLRIEDGLSVVYDLSSRGLHKPQQGTSRGGLSAAGLSHQSQGLTLMDAEADIVHSLYYFFRACHREVLLQIGGFHQNFFFHQSSPSLCFFSNSAFWISQQAL